MPGNVNKTKSKETKKTAKPVVASAQPATRPTKIVQAELSSEDEDDEDEDGGVDEEGMAKLMKALGKDGLDDIGNMQLGVLEGGEDDSEEDGSGEDEDGEGEEDLEDEVEGEGAEGSGSGEEGSDEDEDELEVSVDASKVKASKGTGGVKETEEEEREEEEIALEDAESVDEDVVPRQKLVVDNKVALERIRDTIKLDSSLSWTETLTVTYPEVIEVDVDDDLNRELAFYKQALHGATSARKLADQHKLAFTRPTDYFAEMVKSDAHMERIRQRLLDEGASIKKSEDKRKEREGKKFGKQVQIEKQKERERSKKEMEERLKGLKRKNKDVLNDAQTNDDAFDVAVEDAISDRPSKRSKGAPPKISRKGRDAKFGFGGKDRRSKQNTRESTEKFDFGSRKGAGGKGATSSSKPKRLGKSRRMASKGR
ncbi:eukaryotic rRNA processing [Phellopilus nigrolimitatus]|nr:eukaryotic rRNA processing [Phellopilus nigrolimitatus]